jgi:hypothetical protein
MENLREFRAASLTRLKVRLEAGQEKLARLDQRFFYARLTTLLVGAAASMLALIYGEGALGLVVLALFIAAFAAVVIFHRRVDRAQRRIQLALTLTDTQARLAGHSRPAAGPS